MRRNFYSEESEGLFNYICETNKSIMNNISLPSLHRYGLNNEGSLIYICNTIFSYKPYIEQEILNCETLVEKIAYLIYNLNSAHVFLDGNKRTILNTVFQFLENEDFLLEEPEDVLDNDVFKGALAEFLVTMLEEKQTYNDILIWVKSRIKLK